MIIEARFASTCPSCGGAINVGSEVEWERGQKARHARCAGGGASGASRRSAAPRRAAAARTGGARRSSGGGQRSSSPPAPKPGEQEVTRPSRGPEDGYEKGVATRFTKITGGGGPDGLYWTVTAAGKFRGDEDMGYFEPWYAWAHIRPATDAEVAPVVARIEAAAQVAEVVKALEASKVRGEVDARLLQLPKGVEVLWQDVRMAGSESWYIDAAGVVWYMQSSYDDGPAVWRTTATREQVEAVKSSGRWRPNLLEVRR